MRKSIYTILAGALVALGVVLPTQGASAVDEPGTSPENPIIVADPTMVPSEAIEDEVSTYVTEAQCDTTRSWVLTTPEEPETSHTEFRWSVVLRKDIYRWSVLTRQFVPGTPATEEEGHWEQGPLLDPGHDAVYATEYFYTNRPVQDEPENGREERWYAEGEQPGGFVKVQPEQSRQGDLITPAQEPTYGPEVWVVDQEADEGTPDSYTNWKWTRYTDWQESTTPPAIADPDLTKYDTRYHDHTKWKWDHYTEWQVSPVAPAIIDDLTKLGSKYERSVGNDDGKPEVVTHYAWSDGADCPPQPSAETDTKVLDTDYQCGDDFATVTTQETTTPYVWDSETLDWVPGEPQVADPVTDTMEHEVVECPMPPVEQPQPEPENPVKHTPVPIDHSEEHPQTPDTDCADYLTQAAAQTAYEAGETDLDGDSDGVACETNSQAGPVTPVSVLPNTGGPEVGMALMGLALLSLGVLLVRSQRQKA